MQINFPINLKLFLKFCLILCVLLSGILLGQWKFGSRIIYEKSIETFSCQIVSYWKLPLFDYSVDLHIYRGREAVGSFSIRRGLDSIEDASAIVADLGITDQAVFLDLNNDKFPVVDAINLKLNSK